MSKFIPLYLIGGLIAFSWAALPDHGPWDHWDLALFQLVNGWLGQSARWADLTPQQRRDKLEEIYQNGSLKLWLASFAEMFFDEAVSAEISEFIREKMRARLKDQKLCDLLIPKDYGFGTHHVPLETNRRP